MVKTWRDRITTPTTNQKNLFMSMQAEIDELRAALKDAESGPLSDEAFDIVTSENQVLKAKLAAREADIVDLCDQFGAKLDQALAKLAALEVLYLNSLADATQWQLYKARKDAVIAAGMGKKAMRDLSTADAPTCTSDEWLANCPQSVRDLADKIKAGLALQPHQQRVVDEKNELDTKANALSQFIGLSPIFEKLDAAEQERLKLQNDVMWQYSEILAARIAAF